MTVFTKACYWILSWDIRIQPTSACPFSWDTY